MGYFGKQPAGPVLPPNRRRPQTDGGGNESVRETYRGDSARNTYRVSKETAAMANLREWINRVHHVGHHSRFEDDLDVEVRFHIESRAAELQGSGLSRADAITRAHMEFGSITRVAEDSRAAWQFRWIEDLAGDLRYGLRSFQRSPGFGLTAILSLALGIGANAAIFNAAYTILWKPLPVSKPEELVKLSISDSAGKAVPPLAFVRQLRSAEIFEGVSVRSIDGLSFSFSNDDRAERV